MEYNYYLYLIYPISFLIVFFLCKNRNKYRLFSGLILLYMASSFVGSMIGLGVIDVNANKEPKLIPILFHIVMLIVLLLPFKSYDKFRYSKLKPINSSLLRPFTYLIIIFCLIGIYGDIQNINVNAIMTDIVSIRDELQENEKAVSFTDHFSFFCKHYGCVALALAYYYMKYFPKDKFTIVLLIICSLSSVFAGLQNGGREYLIKYVFIYIVFLYYSKPEIDTYWKKTNRSILIVFSSLAVVVFAVITVLRFSYSGQMDSNTVTAMFNYMGQGFANFSAIFNHFPDGVAGGGMHFPIFVGHSFSVINLNQSINSSLSLNTFSTTIGSWVFDAGIYATVFIVLIYQTLMRYVGRRKFDLFTMIYMLWFYEFIFSCLFFHNQIFSLARLLSFVAIFIVEQLMKANSVTAKSIR